MAKTEQTSNDNNVLQLQNMMFEQMKRLSDPDADLDKEIKRSQALSSAGTVIINAAKVQIDHARTARLIEKDKGSKPKQLTNGSR